MNIDNLFFELIQVALGCRACLSHSPTSEEWKTLYDKAKKQSLVGVCFAGVQRLQTRRQEPPEMLYLTWMGMAAKIQQRNEVVNRQCVELQKRLSADGLNSVILKGQGVAALYKVSRVSDGFIVSDLSGLRQSGDIDVWVLPNKGETDKEHIARVVKYAKGFNPESHFSGKHIDLSVFNDPSTRSGELTEVELHVTPAKMNCPMRNRRLQKWFQKASDGFRSVTEPVEVQEVFGFSVPTTEFNLVYLLLHCYDHLLFEGVGLRQVMDYYFVLRDYGTKTTKTASVSAESQNEPLSNVCSSEIVSNTSTSSAQRLPSSADQSLTPLSGSADTSAKNIKNIRETLQSLGLLKFASAMMWVLKEVFGLEEQYMICKPNESEGRFLLNEVMTGGNFGKYGKDGVMEGHAKGKVAFFLARMKRNWRFLTHYPSEIIWSPYAMLSHWMWKRNVKI